MFLNPFDGARAKIARAHKHLGELRAAEIAYSAAQPLDIDLELQENGDTSVVAKIRKLPEPEHCTVVADLANNLRSSLDIATVQACIALGQKDPKLLSKTYFAIGGSEQDWWNNVNAKHSRMMGADQTIREAVASFKTLENRRQLGTLRPY